MTADGRAKRSFADERSALQFTFEQPSAAGQIPYRCDVCQRWHLASS